MSEFTIASRDWDGLFTDDEPRLLYEYIVGPEPFSDNWFDEGGGD